MRIREAAADDVERMSRVLVSSITELCHAGHGGNQSSIASWTANKTPEALSEWMADRANRVLVAEEAGEILCVGAFRESEIQLNYIAPPHRSRGVSKAMLERLEEEMRTHGVTLGHLTSTATALQFYRSAGWRDTGEAIDMFGFARAQPMRKKLGPGHCDD